METTGLDQQAEIVQISCTSPDSNHEFSQNIFPEKRMTSESATNIHGLSVEYKCGQKLLIKDGIGLTAISQEQEMPELCNFLRKQDKPFVLIACNVHRFDFPILFNCRISL